MHYKNILLFILRRGKKIYMVLVPWFSKTHARAGIIFFIRIFIFKENLNFLLDIGYTNVYIHVGSVPNNVTHGYDVFLFVYAVSCPRRIRKARIYIFNHSPTLCVLKNDWRINKKMCRARGKSRARGDQNHIIFFASPKIKQIIKKML